MVKPELLHEAWIWFSEGSGLADEVEGGFGIEVRLRGDEVGDYEGCGAGFSHRAVGDCGVSVDESVEVLGLGGIERRVSRYVLR